MPELAYLQLASTLEIPKLILLGILLCSKPNTKDQKPVTTKQRLLHRIHSASGLKGKSKALRALQYVEDSCRSPLEALLFMLLSLPHALGGYGLSGFIFDYEIVLNGENAKVLGKRSVFADLYHEETRLILEYDSKEFHSDPKSLAYDAKRSTALIRQKYDVFSIRTEQLYDEGKFLIVVKNISSKLGKRIRIRCKSFTRQHALLRSLLPRLKSVDN